MNQERIFVIILKFDFEEEMIFVTILVSPELVVRKHSTGKLKFLML